MTIDIQTRYEADTAVVAAVGDVDLATAGLIEQAIADALAHSGVTGVEVDLSGVEFLDSSGISVLLKGRRMADRAGSRYRVVRAHDIALRVLEVSGVWDHLHGPTE
jgi:anti-sigma B factor antagonist